MSAYVLSYSAHRHDREYEISDYNIVRARHMKHMLSSESFQQQQLTRSFSLPGSEIKLPSLSEIYLLDQAAGPGAL